MKAVMWIGIVLLISAFLVGFHHLVISGKFFDVKDVLHHEFIMALLGGTGLGIIVGSSTSVQSDFQEKERSES